MRDASMAYAGRGLEKPAAVGYNGVSVMSDWIDVSAENALAEGEHIVVDVDGVDVAVFKLDGKFYAIEDVCTHDGAEIASGDREGDVIICPRHGARFCIKTGAVLSPP